LEDNGRVAASAESFSSVELKTNERCVELAGTGVSPTLLGRRPCNYRPQTCQNGVYELNPRGQSLPRVVHRPEDACALQCSACGYTIMSAWFFTLPSTGEECVLRPHNGHPRCNGAQFKATNGKRTCRDVYDNLDICEHMRIRKDCAKCGGRHSCVHGKIMRFCSACSTLRRGRFGGRVRRGKS